MLFVIKADLKNDMFQIIIVKVYLFNGLSHNLL